LHDREDLVESVIHPGLDDAQEALLEVFEEMEVSRATYSKSSRNVVLSPRYILHRRQ
jgi:hypothetical protein